MVPAGGSGEGESERALPRRFGDYVLVEHLAQSPRADTWVAMQAEAPGAPGLCILKSLHRAITADPAYVQRFLSAARAAVQLHHPHIAAVVDVGKVEEVYYLATEHVPGRTLHEVLQRAARDRVALPTTVALTLLSELFDALDYAHHRTHSATQQPLHFVHRELGPDSVRVSFAGDLKLMDIGLVRSALELERTLPGAEPGRLAYQSPEQVRGEELDARSDVFAAAVLCFEVLSGGRYYPGKTADEVWQLASTGGFIPPALQRLPSGLRLILERALRAERNRRTPSCAQLRRELLAHFHEVQARPNAVRAFMSGLFPGAEAVSRRHLEALCSMVAPRLPAGATGRFVERVSVASAEAPTVVRDVSLLRQELSAPDTMGALASTAPSRPMFSLPPTDAEPVTRDRLRRQSLADADVVTEPEYRAPTVPGRKPKG